MAVKTKRGQVAFDFDETLVTYNGWKGFKYVGEPIKPMVDLAKKYIAEDEYEVIIFTARVSPEIPGPFVDIQRELIQDWTEKHLGKRLPVTCIKSRDIVHYFDDRASGVVPNEGKIIGGEPVIRPHALPNGVPLDD